MAVAMEKKQVRDVNRSRSEFKSPSTSLSQTKCCTIVAELKTVTEIKKWIILRFVFHYLFPRQDVGTS